MGMTGLCEGGNAQLLLNENLLQDYVLRTRAVHHFLSLSIRPLFKVKETHFLISVVADPFSSSCSLIQHQR